MKISSRPWSLAAVVVCFGVSAGCAANDTTGNSPINPWKAGVFAASSSFANQCAAPRTGTDPTTGKPFPDVTGSTLAENNFLRSWTNELYLWYREVPDLDPSAYATADYFNVLKTSATTPSGNKKDKFHFTYPTDQWVALSQSGVEAGYGADFAVLAAAPPRKVVVAFIQPNSPASRAHLERGAEVRAVDGVDVVTGSDTNTINDGLFPSAAGASHTFSILDRGATTTRTITMVSANVTATPVQQVQTIRNDMRTVGYMVFNDHIATAEQLLVSAFRQLAAAPVDDLVLDIRYNGGGYLDIASEVAFMVAGPAATNGRTFEKTVFNDKHTTTDPVTGEALTPVPFHSTTQGFSGPAGQALPSLNLRRVTVLTSSGTCSASESIINSLRGIGVEVIEIGGTTCGKPYGFYPQDNCGTTYFSIQFQGINDQGFGDYPDGFSPRNATSSLGVALPGCAVADDFGHALGDVNERRLAAALGYLASGSCPAPTAVAPGTVSASAGEPVLHRSPWRENRIYRH